MRSGGRPCRSKTHSTDFLLLGVDRAAVGHTRLVASVEPHASHSVLTQSPSPDACDGRETLGDRHTNATAPLVGALEETRWRGWDRVDAST